MKPPAALGGAAAGTPGPLLRDPEPGTPELSPSLAPPCRSPQGSDPARGENAGPSPSARGGGPAARRPTSRGRALTAAERRALRMSETNLQNAVIKLCEQLGILWYHAYQPMRDPAGWADLSMSGWHGTIFRELKAEGEKPTPKQAEWGQRMLASGENWAVWYPADLQSGRIARELAVIR